MRGFLVMEQELNPENLDQGYVKIYRSIQDHWIWGDIFKGGAWIDLIMLARWHPTPKQTMINTRLLECRRGELLVSETTLAKRWKCERGYVHRFLLSLQKASMIRVTSEQVTSRITIVNYDSYNPLQTADAPRNEHAPSTLRAETHRETSTLRTETHTKEEGKKERLEEGKNKSSPPHPPLVIDKNLMLTVTTYAEYLEEFFPGYPFDIQEQYRYASQILKAGYTNDQLDDVCWALVNHNHDTEGKFRWIQQVRSFAKLLKRPKPESPNRAFKNWMEFFLVLQKEL